MSNNTELSDEDSILFFGKLYIIGLLAGMTFLMFYWEKVESFEAAPLEHFLPSVLSWFGLVVLLFVFLAANDKLWSYRVYWFFLIFYSITVSWLTFEGIFGIVIQDNVFLASFSLALLTSIGVFIMVYFPLRGLVRKTLSYEEDRTRLIFISWGTTLFMAAIASLVVNAIV